MASIFDQARKTLKDLQSKATTYFNAPIQAKGIGNRNVPQPLQPVRNFGNAAVNQVRNDVARGIPAAFRVAAPAFGQIQDRQNGLNYFQSQQRQATDLFNTAKLGSYALGAPRIASKAGAMALTSSGILGGGLSKAMGGSFAEGAGQGVGMTPSILGITGITNPLIEKGVSRFAPKIASNISKLPLNNYLSSSVVRGLGNIPEGALIDASLGRRPLSLGSAGLDFATGFLGKSTPTRGVNTDDLIKKGKALGIKGVNPEAFLLHPEDRDMLSSIGQSLGKKPLTDLQEQSLNVLYKKYMPGVNLDTVKPTLLRKQIAWLMDINEQVPKGQRQEFPGMGFVGKADAKSISQSIQETSSQKVGNIIDFDPQSYIKELKDRQSAAGNISNGIKGKISSFNTKIKSALIDSTAPIEDALSLAEKKGKFQVRPTQDIRLQIDRVLRAKTIASQFAEDNGLVDVIKKAPDLDALDQYMIAKQAGKVAELGKTTGRNLDKDQQLINALAPEYEQYAKSVNQYSQKLLDYSVESGLIDPSLATALKQKYPEYVPLQRVFNELEKTNYSGSTKAVASLSKQSVVQKLEGSEREIASPIESLLLKTQTAFEQGEKNRAGKMLAGYKDLPGFQNLIRELKGDEKATHTFSYLDNGVKRTFETSPEIAAAAKNLNQEQMNIVLKTLAVPTRTLQLGATGLNVPFVVTNLAKDQITAFVNSNKAAKTSLLNPNNFLKAMFSAVKHDDLYDEVVRNAAGGTSFDISRQAPNLSVARIRAGRSAGSKIAYTVRRPGELLRALENIVGRTEELTRIQQYRGTKNALLSEGRTAQDAALLGAKAARENTTNFARKGDIGKVVNYIIPFFNAGIQGARTLTRNVQQRPAQTGAKATIAIFMPVAATTMWNLTDPARKAIYDDIDEFEKQNNLIIIPDDAKLDEKGRYNVIKIPLPPGLSNLGSIVRRGIETANGYDPIKLQEIATNVIAAGTSIDLSSPTKTISSFIPQAVKGTVETQTNTNLFTGKPIVPYSLQDLPPNEQARPYTSGTARMLAKVPLLNTVTGDSPLKVENFIRTTAGGLGSQLLNASDTALSATGAIPKEQISGENALQNLQRRFSQASGGNQQEQEFKKITEYKQEAALGQNEARVKAESVVKQLQNATTPDERRQILTSNISTEKELDQVISLMEDASAGTTSSERAVRALPVEQRASYISEKISNVSKEEKKKILIDYYKKGILTEAVLDQMLGL